MDKLLSTADILDLITTVTKQLEEKIENINKPYVDPERGEQRQRNHAKLKETEEKRKALTKNEQDHCVHIAGAWALGGLPDPHGRTSIVWHDDTGICSHCQRVFRPDDSDYIAWRRKPSFNRLSLSGKEVPLDDDDREEIAAHGLGNFTSDELWVQHFAQENPKPDNLPDWAVDILYEKALGKLSARKKSA